MSQFMGVLMRYLKNSVNGFKPKVVGPYADRLVSACGKLDAHYKAVSASRGY